MTVNGVAEYQWRATMSGLAPAAQYCYRVEFGTAPSVLDLLGTDPSISFSSQLPAGATAPFSFAVLGDFGAVGTSEAGVDNRQADVMTQIAKSGARFVMGAGDTAYPSGTQTTYGDLNQTGSNVSTIFGPQFWPKFGASTPFFSATGNHGFNSTFLTNWPQPTAASDPDERYAMETYCCPNGTNSASYPSAWYAFDVGVARFYVLEAAWSSSNVGTADQYKNDYDTHWTPSEPRVPLAREGPAGEPVAAEVRLLPLSDVLVERDGGVRPLAAGPEQPRGPARPQRRGDRLQRPRAQLHAQREARRRAGHLRHGRRRRSVGAGDEVQCAGGLRDRLVVHDRRQRLRHAATDLDRRRSSTS